MSSYDISANQNVDSIEQMLVSLNKDFQIISRLGFNNFKGTANWLSYKVDDYSANLIDAITNMKNDLVDIDLNVLKQKKTSKTDCHPNSSILKNKKQYWKRLYQIWRLRLLNLTS